MNYDVIILGAGLSGLTCGYLLKKQNKKVLIIEKEKLSNKDKLCGGLFTKKSYNLFNEIFNNKLNFKHFDNFIINNKLIIKNDFYSIYRKDLDDYILEEYLNINGEIIDNIKSYDLKIDSNTIIINNKEYQYNYLVGADGVFSNLRKLIAGKDQRKNFAYEIIGTKTDNIKINFYTKFKGYSWMIPNYKNTMIGIGDVSQNIKIDDYFNNFINDINVEKRNLRGAFLPTGDDFYLNYKNIFFVGDSAGLISPIIGEGIYYALLSSKILSENIGKNYKLRCHKMISKLKFEKCLKKIIYNDFIRNFIFNHYQKNILIRCISNIFIKLHL